MAYGMSSDHGEIFPYLLDTNTLDIGIEGQKSKFMTFIHKDTVIPTRQTRVMALKTNDQGNIVIEVYRWLQIVTADSQSCPEDEEASSHSGCATNLQPANNDSQTSRISPFELNEDAQSERKWQSTPEMYLPERALSHTARSCEGHVVETREDARDP